jgi:hypothetical protein
MALITVSPRRTGSGAGSGSSLVTTRGYPAGGGWASTLSPGRLDFRPRWQWAFGGGVVIEVLGVHGSPRLPGSNEILKLPGPIVQVKTSTGTLEWAVNVRYGPDAIARLGVEYTDPDPDSNE